MLMVVMYICVKSLIYIFIYKILTSGTLEEENFLHLKNNSMAYWVVLLFLNA